MVDDECTSVAEIALGAIPLNDDDEEEVPARERFGRFVSVSRQYIKGFEPLKEPIE